MNAARRTLGCWILSAFLERGCDPMTARLPRPVRRVRALTPDELAALCPLAGRLASETNLRRMRRPRHPRRAVSAVV